MIHRPDHAPEPPGTPRARPRVRGYLKRALEYSLKITATARTIEVEYNDRIKGMMDLLRRGEGVVKVIEHGRTRTETQSTRGKPPLSLLRRYAARDAAQAAVPLLAVAALAAGRKLHRALVARQSAAARDCFKGHRLAAFACRDFGLLRFDNGRGHAALSGSANAPPPRTKL